MVINELDPKIIKFAAFSSPMSAKRAAAAAATLQLQQYLFESIQNIKQPCCTKIAGMLALDSGVVITGETAGRDHGPAERTRERGGQQKA